MAITFTRTSDNGKTFCGVYRKGGEAYCVQAHYANGEVFAGMIDGPRGVQKLIVDKHVRLVEAVEASLS